MRRLLVGLVLGAFGLTTGHVVAQTDASVLVSAWRDALEHDATYRAARDEARAAREQLAQARAAWGPAVVASATAQRNHLDQTVGGTTRSASYYSSNLGLQWRQPLLSRELEGRETLARLRADQAEALLAVRRADLTRRLVEAWLDLVRAERLGAFLDDESTRQLALVDTARKGLASGEGTVTDLLEATSRVELLRAQQVSAEAARDDALDALAVITGRRAGWASPGASAPGAARVPMPPTAGALEAALPDHPQLRFRRLALDMAQAEVRLARAADAPRLDWIASASRGDSETVNSVNQLNRLWSAGLQFTLPLLDGGRADSGARAALALVDKAQAEYDDTERSLQSESRQMLRSLNASRERALALQAAWQSSTQLVAATRRSVTAGLRSRLDLLLAERQLAQVQREQDQAFVDHLRAWWRATALQRQTAEADLLLLEQSLR